MVTVLRPLSTSELLDRTFHLYRNKFALFLGIMAIPQLIVLAIQLVGSGLELGGSVISGTLLTIVGGLASFVAIEVSQAATVMAVSDIHLDRPVSIGSAFSSSRGSIGRVVWISFVVAIAIGAAAIFLIIPGIYVALMWSLAIPVTILEGGGLGVSTDRSKALTKGSRGRIFVIYLLVGVLAIVISLILQTVLVTIAGVISRGNPTSLLALVHAMQAIASFLGTSLVGSLGTIALTLVYYDLRVRKEGFDLQLMMARLQPNTQAAAATPNS